MGSLSRGTKEEIFSILPAGTVLPFAGATAPAGWALCDGGAISRTDYVELFTAIGELWGNGDGSTTFNLPDMRGQFLRGKNNGRIDGQEDPDGERAIGNQQEDAAQKTEGQFSIVARDFGGYSPPSGTVQQVSTHQSYDSGPSDQSGGRRYKVDNSAGGTYKTSGDGSGNGENRPKNVAVNYIIKL
jgi:microcystin-dependent protein